MGRKAKLRQARCGEVVKLREKHIRQLQHDYDLKPSFVVSLPTDGLGDDEELRRKQKIALSVISSLPPDKKIDLMGGVAGEVVTRGWDQLPRNLRILYSALQQCEFDEFLREFLVLQGCFRFGWNHDLDWLQIRGRLVEFMDHPLAREGCRRRDSCKDSEFADLAWIPGMLAGDIRAATQEAVAAVQAGKKTLSEVVAIGAQLDLMDSHIQAVEDITCGRLLYRAGRLHLHYRKAEKITDAELCLSHRSADGILSFFPEPASRVRISDIRKMRHFTASYKGPTINGMLSDHPQAARLCRLVGLNVRHGYGFLEATSNT
jgi:hypothetical protein